MGFTLFLHISLQYSMSSSCFFCKLPEKNVLFSTLLPQHNLINILFILLGIVKFNSILFPFVLGTLIIFMWYDRIYLSFLLLPSSSLSQGVAIIVNYFTTHLWWPTVQLKFTNLYKRPISFDALARNLMYKMKPQ